MVEKWTPGPWRIEYEPYAHVRSDAGCVFASDYTTPANAALIAAAPALMEAAQRALFVFDSPLMPSWANGGGAVDLLRAAISAAKGE